MSKITNPTEEQLQSAMDFDHVILIEADGALVSHPHTSLYAPTVEHYKDELDVSQLGLWELMSGYTGQYSYNGPVMHASEYIGGTLAQDILSTPGYYVAITVEAPCDYDGETECTEGQGCDCEPAGWAIARIEA